MSKLSAEQIAQHAYDAGFRGEALTTAVAVALAESGGNTRAHNHEGLDNSYGLWQINMLGDLGPARRRQYGLDSNKDLFDPDENAKAAYQIWKDDGDRSFRHWSTYENGAYKKHLDDARKAVRHVGKGKGNGKGSGGGQRPGKPGGDGFTVQTEYLRTYAKQADGVADGLEAVGKKTVHAVRGIAEDTFGRVGKETGFTDALGDFSDSLKKQVTATGTNARNLGKAASEAARTYEEADQAAVRELKAALG
ncbi:hypothetical protein GCM10011581_22050 [Saccharopolyspora subtropica]|uniref:Transglycosylase SLT domain-containing protein n=1 Tax=Saccharopolyspora thermophila TaxID=89367 RepID=A0A917NCN1_9PSEU|nr:type VII secretion target [Saccharopolyspora subtropica]GGI84523.1 hypothetical protein GCM10011581_22050 [Saccharopolyspora subtropica]